MKRRWIVPVLVLALSSVPALAEAPPSRPLAITPAQFQALRQIETEPQNAAVRQVHATYQSEHEREMERVKTIDDATSAATFAGMIGAIVTILIMGVF